jgi:4-hydroxy-tetrahydrodipicolinate synthase
MRLKLDGIIPALLTPFKRGGTEIDFDKAAAWAEELAKRGVDGIFVCGSSGEGLLMSIEERKQLACVLMDAVGSRIKVVIQTGCLDTPRTIELTRYAHEIGVHAVSVYSPSFYRYDDEALFRHFKLIGDAVPGIPLLLYNIPRYTGNSLSPELIFRIASSVKSVAGMKDSSGDMGHVSRIIAGAPKNFLTINGADEFVYQAFVTGAIGAVSLTANVVPELFLTIRKETAAGNHKKALATQNKLNTIIDALGGGAMISAYKEALRLMGYDTGFVRPPQRELTAAEKKSLANRLKAAGLV